MNRSLSQVLHALALGALVAGCSRTDERATPSPPVASASAATSTVAPTGPLAPARGVRLVAAPAGVDLPAYVRTAAEGAKADHRRFVVYVGASWCEPCQYFHKAAAAGALDDAFPDLTVLEFDADRDGTALRAASYGSQYIPLFARPGGDGRGSAQRFEGSIKGEGAVADLTGKLRNLLREGS